MFFDMCFFSWYSYCLQSKYVMQIEIGKEGNIVYNKSKKMFIHGFLKGHSSKTVAGFFVLLKAECVA